MEETSERARRAAQSILENESLTDGLDDSAASKLVEWGVTRAKATAAQTAAMSEVEAEVFLEENLRSLRRMLKGASRWAQALVAADVETARGNLLSAVEQAAGVYGQSFRAPDSQQVESMLSPIGEPAGEIGTLLVRLRSLFEASAPDQRSAAILPEAAQASSSLVPSQLTPSSLTPSKLTPSSLSPSSQTPEPLPSTSDPPPDPALLADENGEMPPSYTYLEQDNEPF